jgi:carboxyl-terminal processing protease
VGGRERGGNRYAPGHAVFLATTALTLTPDLADHGVFTQALLDGLKGAADRMSPEPDGLVTVYELSRYLEKHVPELLAPLKKSPRSFKAFSGYGVHSDFPITLNPAVARTTEAQVRQFEALARQRGLGRELVDEGRFLLGRYPTVESHRELRKLYRSFLTSAMSGDRLNEGRLSVLKRAELPRLDAEIFAGKILAAVRILEEQYVRRVNPGELIGWAIDALYHTVDDPVPDELQTRFRRLKTETGPALRSFLVRAREALGRRSDLDSHVDIDVAFQGILSRLDSQSAYVSPKEKGTLDRFINRTFTGIGAVIELDPDSDFIRVKTPLKGSPAQRAGLQSGDVITSVISVVGANGNTLSLPEVTSTKGLEIDKVRDKLIGKPGTFVKLSVLRPGKGPEILTIRRDSIELETVLGNRRQPDGNWQYMLDDALGVGYVRISSFSPRTLSELRGVIEGMQQQGLQGLVLDLRFNSGGLLQSCLDVADLFIDDETIVITRSRVNGDQPYKGQREGSNTTFPMVCLVNKGTASGSEIIAACLQHHGRATVLGERTIGVASVRTRLDFDGGELLLMTATFVGPSGRNLDRDNAGNTPDEWGVVPTDKPEFRLTRQQRDALETHLNDLEVLPRTDGLGKPPTSRFNDQQLGLAVHYLGALLSRKGVR